MARDLERPGAVRHLRGFVVLDVLGRDRLGEPVLLRPGLIQNVGGIELRGQDRVRRLERHLDREVVLLGPDRVGGDIAPEVGARHLEALHREDDVVGGQGVAVLEFHVLANVEDPVQRIGHLPALGQPGDDLELLVALGEALVDVAEHAQREGLVQRIGIERVERALEREAQRLGARRGGQRDRAHQRGGKRQFFERHG